MTISELIKALEAAKEKHGDLDVVGLEDSAYTPTMEVAAEPFEEWRNRHRIFGDSPPEKIVIVRPWVQGYREAA